MARLRTHSKRRRSGKGSRTKGVLFSLLFGGLFAAVGTGMFIFFTLLPLWNIYDAQSWTDTPCTITHAQVESHSDSDGTTYSIDIRYTYQVNGKTYRGDTYRFAPPGSSSGYDGKRKAVDANPVGSTQTCYVDPDDPTRSVIQRGMTAALWWGLFPIPFMLAGFGVMYAGLTGKINFNTSGGESDWRPTAMQPADAPAGAPGAAQTPTPTPTPTPHNTSALSWTDADGDEPVVLDPAKSRKTSFIGIGVFALIWNGVLGIIGYNVLKDASAGDIFSFEQLFFAPFVIIGLVMLVVTGRKLMLVFAPHIVIELGRDALPLGGSTLLRWHVADARKRVEQVRIQLIGEEQATYRRGTDTITDTETFYQQWLVGEDPGATGRARMPMVADHGDIVLKIPADTMHSFEANNNKIIWKLVVQAEVASWPDPKDQYTVTVLPIPID